MTSGRYFGGTWGLPLGVGAGLYFDDLGRAYPQLYFGTPGPSVSGGRTSDLEGLLTGSSVSASFGRGPVQFNGAASDGATGIGIGTPGAGFTYGFGPYEFSDDFSQPWAKSYIRDSAARAQVPSRYNVWEYDYPDSISAPNTSGTTAGATSARSPQQIADWLTKRFRKVPDPFASNKVFIRDSSAAASVPSRNNVFEYGFPEPDSGTSSSRATLGPTSAPQVDSANFSGGLPGRIAALTGIDASGPMWPVIRNQPSADVFRTGAPPLQFVPSASQGAPAGMTGFLQEFLRNN